MSKRLYVGNLPFTVTEPQLQELFAPYGASRATIPIDENGRSKGFGFVDIDDAQLEAAVAAMNGKQFSGRALNVNEARPRAERAPRSGGYGGGYGGGDRGGGRRDRW